MLTTTTNFDPRINKDVLAMQICEVCGAMTPVYNTTDSFVVFHDQFFKMWKTQISKLLDTMEYDYKPLENFRKESERELHNIEDRDDTRNSKANRNENYSTSSSSAAEHKVSAYNESAYQPDTNEEDKTNGSGNSGRNDSMEEGYTKDSKFDENEKEYVHGLSGMYSTQQLLKQEREVAEFNVYQWIVKKYQEVMMINIF